MGAKHRAKKRTKKIEKAIEEARKFDDVYDEILALNRRISRCEDDLDGFKEQDFELCCAADVNSTKE